MPVAISFHRAEMSTGKPRGFSFDLFEQGLEAVLGQQAHVLGEHGEEAALEESGDDLRVVAVGFEGLGQHGEAAGDVAGDLGGDFRGIERMGIEPDLRGGVSRISGRWRSGRVMRCETGSGKRSYWPPVQVNSA